MKNPFPIHPMYALLGQSLVTFTSTTLFHYGCIGKPLFLTLHLGAFAFAVVDVIFWAVNLARETK